MHLLTGDHASEMGLALEGTVSEICKRAGVNRTQVYEKKAQLRNALGKVDLPEPGRVPNKSTLAFGGDTADGELQVTLLRYRLDNPGAFVRHPGGRTGYSPGFIRIVLDLLDDWTGSLERFCELSEVPYPTLEGWRKMDASRPYLPATRRPVPFLDPGVSEITRMIVEDYAGWQGSLGDFLAHEPRRVNLPPNQVRRALVITGMIGSGKQKAPATEEVRKRPGRVRYWLPMVRRLRCT